MPSIFPSEVVKAWVLASQLGGKWAGQTRLLIQTEGGCPLRDKGLGAEWVFRKGGGRLQEAMALAVRMPLGTRRLDS